MKVVGGKMAAGQGLSSIIILCDVYITKGWGDEKLKPIPFRLF